MKACSGERERPRTKRLLDATPPAPPAVLSRSGIELELLRRHRVHDALHAKALQPRYPQVLDASPKDGHRCADSAERHVWWSLELTSGDGSEDLSFRGGFTRIDRNRRVLFLLWRQSLGGPSSTPPRISPRRRVSVHRHWSDPPPRELLLVSSTACRMVRSRLRQPTLPDADAAAAVAFPFCLVPCTTMCLGSEMNLG